MRKTIIEPFKPTYTYFPIAKLVEQYKQDKKSWKYTSVLINAGSKEYITSTIDGVGNEIKIFKRVDFKSLSVAQSAKQKNISVSDVYNYHYDKVSGCC